MFMFTSTNYVVVEGKKSISVIYCFFILNFESGFTIIIRIIKNVLLLNVLRLDEYNDMVCHIMRNVGTINFLTDS